MGQGLCDIEPFKREQTTIWNCLERAGTGCSPVRFVNFSFLGKVLVSEKKGRECG